MEVHPFTRYELDQHAVYPLIVSVTSLRCPQLLCIAYFLCISQSTIKPFGGLLLGHKAAFHFVLLRQDDIDRLVEHPKILRDQIIIDFSRLQGLRTHEIATERWSNVSPENGFISVWDSKKHVPVLLPLHWRLAEQLMRLKEETAPSDNDWIIRPLPNVNVKKSAWGKPISNDAIHDVVKGIARDAGIFEWRRYNSTLLRAYFAADWVRQRRSLKMLQYMMRHNSLAMTFRYVSKILFWSELEREFDRVQQIPVERRMKKLSVNEMLERPMAKQCLRCPAVSVCKYVDEAVQSEWAEGCRFFRQIVEKALETKMMAVQQT